MPRTKASEHMEKGRISARVPANVQETIKKAAELNGVPLNSYIIQAVHQHAQEFIDRHEMKNMVLSVGDSEWFLEQLAKPRQPNAKMRRAMAAYQEVSNVEDNNPAIVVAYS